MPSDAANATPGLGTSIVEALARQLNATIKISDRKPGTGVSIVHAQLAALEGGKAASHEQAI
jgi:two-component system, sensor histidine kinase PdtaS